MRADQPVSAAAAPTVSGPGIRPTLAQACEGLRCRRALAPVGVLEPHHVVELRGRDLEDGRVLERGHAMDGARAVVERVAGATDPLGDPPLPATPELDLPSPRLHEPRLLFLAVE